MNLGQHIVDSVVEAGAIERMIEDRDGGNTIFVWSSNANEQVEAAFLKRMDNEVRNFVGDPECITGFLAFLAEGAKRGDPSHRIATLAMSAVLLQFLGIDPKQPPQ